MFRTILVLFLLSSSAYALSAITCDGGTFDITCPDNENILITEANYGRTSLDICPTNVPNQSTTCTNSATTMIVSIRCNNQNNCAIPVNSAVLGDSCPGTSKYLYANFTCNSVKEVPSALRAITCDGGTFDITCPDNETIHITEANYGRTSLDICPTNVPNQSTDCTNSTITTTLSKRCNNKNNCAIPVNSAVLGDPCPGTSKYLYANFTCGSVTEVPISCGINEHHTQCGSNCEQTCTDTCPQLCIASCVAKCVCNDGYVRDPATNKCILRKYCPKPGNSAETHEIFTSCGASCEQTCSSLLSNCQPGYICERGYFRDGITGKCVLPRDCPRNHGEYWP